VCGVASGGRGDVSLEGGVGCFGGDNIPGGVDCIDGGVGVVDCIDGGVGVVDCLDGGGGVGAFRVGCDVLFELFSALFTLSLIL
jgi:hypothetical protein